MKRKVLSAEAFTDGPYISLLLNNGQSKSLNLFFSQDDSLWVIDDGETLQDLPDNARDVIATELLRVNIEEGHIKTEEIQDINVSEFERSLINDPNTSKWLREQLERTKSFDLGTAYLETQALLTALKSRISLN